jgi:hypothetical protein
MYREPGGNALGERCGEKVRILERILIVGNIEDPAFRNEGLLLDPGRYSVLIASIWLNEGSVRYCLTFVVRWPCGPWIGRILWRILVGKIEDPASRNEGCCIDIKRCNVLIGFIRLTMKADEYVIVLHLWHGDRTGHGRKGCSRGWSPRLPRILHGDNTGRDEYTVIECRVVLLGTSIALSEWHSNLLNTLFVNSQFMIAVAHE